MVNEFFCNPWSFIIVILLWPNFEGINVVLLATIVDKDFVRSVGTEELLFCLLCCKYYRAVSIIVL
jgi:hypothetical protein